MKPILKNDIVNHTQYQTSNSKDYTGYTGYTESRDVKQFNGNEDQSENEESQFPMFGNTFHIKRCKIQSRSSDSCNKRKSYTGRLQLKIDTRYNDHNQYTLKSRIHQEPQYRVQLGLFVSLYGILIYISQFQ